MSRSFVIESYKNIPSELKQLPQWVCTFQNSKVPMKTWKNEVASSIDKTTWSDFDTALCSVKQGHYDYCGFVFADNGYVGIDIDCSYDEYGLINKIGADIISRCKSYTEVSRSKRGFHIIVKGNLPFKGKNNNKGIEIYKVARYFIMTGNTLIYRNIVENQQAIDYILEKYFIDKRTKEERTIIDKEKIYCPIWKNVVENGRIKIRPTYPEILEGSRNICLTSLAGMMHKIGYSKGQIYNELLYANTIACKPPLDKNELKSICNSVVRYKR